MDSDELLEGANAETDAARSVTNDIWRAEAGRFLDDPTFDDFLNEMQRERREYDSGESYHGSERG